MLSAKWPGGPARALLFLTAAAIVGWSVMFRGTTPQDGPAGGPSAASSVPAVQAPVSEAVVRHMAESAEFVGYLSAVEHVDIRPRISGHIQSIHFAEGALVEAGELLFQIDPRPFEAIAERTRAELARLREQLALAEIQYARAQRLVEERAVSQGTYDETASHRRVLAAEIRAAEAALRSAELDLGYTRVTSPISGRASRALITTGNLVTGETGQATLLTTIVSVDPVHVLFDVDEETYLGALSHTDGAVNPEVVVQLKGETGFPHRGQVDFVDNAVERGTGTVRVRAVLPNPDGRLTPGLFARVRLELSAPRETLLVAERAIGADQGRHFVLVLNGDNIVEHRPVTLGPRIDGLRAVRDGLSADDRIVVGALHRIRPGQLVAPVNVDASATGAAPDDGAGG